MGYNQQRCDSGHSQGYYTEDLTDYRANVRSEEFAADDGYIDQVLENPACGKPECWELGDSMECIEERPLRHKNPSARTTGAPVKNL